MEELVQHANRYNYVYGAQNNNNNSLYVIMCDDLKVQ